MAATGAGMRSSRRQLPITGFAHKATIVGDRRVPTRSVLTTRDVAAEGRRAAALDGTHHLELRHLDHADIDVLLEQVRGERMPQRVR